MAPKEKFTKEQVIEAALSIAEESGFDGITIRKVADRLNSSIAPIYVKFENLDELKKALAFQISEMSFQTITSESTHDTFLDIGAGILRFAMDHPVIYQDHLLNPECRKYFEGIDHHLEVYGEKLMNSGKLKGLSQEARKEIGYMMQLATSGAVLEYFAGQLPFDYDGAVRFLENMGDDLIAGYQHRRNK